MQAGDTLNFIKPFIGAEKQLDAQSEKISPEDLATLNILLSRFISERKGNVHSFDVLESYGFVTIEEASYKLDMPDGSYLHIVVHLSKFENGIIEFGISVNEHLNDSTYNGGYTYSYDSEDGLIRSKSLTDNEAFGDEDDDDEDDNDISKLHFSIADLYANREALRDLEQSEDPDLKEHGQQAREQLNSEIQFDEMMQFQGLDSQPPYPGELETLTELIWDAEPFPLHVTTE